MSTCVKRSVLGAGDRQAAITRAAAAVQAATMQLTQRVQPHAGSPLGAPRMPGMAIPHSTLGGYNPIQDALRNIGSAINNFAREVNNALGEAARESEAAAAGGKFGKFVVETPQQPYVEPMFLPRPTNLLVNCVVCARAVGLANPAERLLNGSEVDFNFVGTQIQINSIDGMSPDPTKVINWVFLLFGI